MFSLYRLIGITIACIILLFGVAPFPTAIISFFIIVAILFFKYYVPLKTEQDGRNIRRKEALRRAKVYLAPYEDIWRDLKLSNPYCYLTLGLDGMTIEGFEKTKGGAFRCFKVLKSNVHDWEEVWNLFCKTFSHNKSYDGLIEDCRRFKLVVEEKVFEKPAEKNFKESSFAAGIVDINNCSEADLAELPGISLIMAKRIVKRRKELGGFDNVEDFFTILKVHSNMQMQLKSLIVVGKKPKFSVNERYTERKVDF